MPIIEYKNKNRNSKAAMLPIEGKATNIVMNII
jgi:hypothetical protein